MRSVILAGVNFEIEQSGGEKAEMKAALRIAEREQAAAQKQVADLEADGAEVPAELQDIADGMSVEEKTMEFCLRFVKKINGSGDVTREKLLAVDAAATDLLAPALVMPGAFSGNSPRGR
jgi:hypothetical protein